MASPLEPATTSCFAASVALLAPGFASQWRLSLLRARGLEWRESESRASAARVPLLSGVSPCPELEPPSGVNPSQQARNPGERR